MKTVSLPQLTHVSAGLKIAGFSATGRSTSVTFETLPMPADEAQAGSILSARSSAESALGSKAGEAQGAALMLICSALSQPRFVQYGGKGTDDQSRKLAPKSYAKDYKPYQKLASEACDLMLAEALILAGVPEGAIQRTLRESNDGGTWSKCKSEALRFYWITGRLPRDDSGDVPRAIGSAGMRALLAKLDDVETPDDLTGRFETLVKDLTAKGNNPDVLFALADLAHKAGAAWIEAATRMEQEISKAREAADSQEYAKAVLVRETKDEAGNIIPASMTPASQPAAVH